MVQLCSDRGLSPVFVPEGVTRHASGFPARPLFRALARLVLVPGTRLGAGGLAVLSRDDVLLPGPERRLQPGDETYLLLHVSTLKPRKASFLDDLNEFQADNCHAPAVPGNAGDPGDHGADAQRDGGLQQADCPAVGVS